MLGGAKLDDGTGSDISLIPSCREIWKAIKNIGGRKSSGREIADYLEKQTIIQIGLSPREQ